ncbi:MAG: hypothetical protein GIX03_14935 [Candidatus Eremiobacteraeota bacterium]|nr:hypothetical protein [Candidatus Eremiobacteraeota bacterium]MBC5804260.1 hypothetical protein [Candidatus Eremiobacteraeota bacterium]MBC5820904.1 hypothetical protein [Candidatus Eremiobacteraeota bacterium]
MLAGGCTAHAAAVAQPVQAPRVPIPIPSGVVDIVPLAAVSPYGFDRRDIDFGPAPTLAVNGSADVAQSGQAALFHVAFSARDVPSMPVRPLNLADAQPIVTALTANGIAFANIRETLRQEPFQAPWQGGRPGAIDIAFDVEHPTQARVRQLSDAIDSAGGYPTFHVFTSAVFVVADCSEALAQARRAAFDNAQTVALTQARQTHQRLGPILEIREEFAGAARGRCGPDDSADRSVQLNIRVPPPDPTDVIVRDQIVLTYAMH